MKACCHVAYSYLRCIFTCGARRSFNMKMVNKRTFVCGEIFWSSTAELMGIGQGVRVPGKPLKCGKVSFFSRMMLPANHPRTSIFPMETVCFFKFLKYTIFRVE